MGIVGLDRDLPALPGAGINAHRLQRNGQQSAGHLLARRDDRVILTRVVERGIGAGDLRHLLNPVHQLVGLAGHRRHHHCHLVPRIDLTLDVPGDIVDPVKVGNRSAAKFHHYAGHAVSSADKPETGQEKPPRRPERKVAIS